MLRSKSIFPILLALSFLFRRAQGFLRINNELIGYAKVSPGLAQQINSDNKPRVEESRTLQQVGPGFYLRSISNWYEDDGNWFCAIEANKNKMKEIVKVWIPKEFESMTWGSQIKKYQLWGQDEEEGAILDYIHSSVMIDEPEKALRFSWIEGVAQMTIPTDVVNNGDLELWAKCFGSIHELNKYSDRHVDWEAIWTIRSSELAHPEKRIPDLKTCESDHGPSGNADNRKQDIGSLYECDR
ncbi:hypothetical protein MBM_01935 [Drepanopeziza brunnea f. sp. 'multigermtubi' MB_m1]|uniref:Uncharacterized protein n=1 Tax=Marssonina brunnea f. sp. multigermtubi (strain MB_m1) TaxID=1072389 RepID=K1XGR6_MARBU|nr:uncharacterized protein MBM_01935 [Drepanopeziza brunnea f. sp. 'multigermtubi' MB_m1]EKD19983.1 hypothetical protein MBM_01935 [Drepanopeziza brunnea f. sp. 'multigermtubi' MB_m1]